MARMGPRKEAGREEREARDRGVERGEEERRSSWRRRVMTAT
ncbi:hypothetical protein E2C01_093847 [Portunus trituberculatus]|uniref:Uncharacterized protein n=1 Tax=Portunus trituberculatus TaxID=210409 RepID=A0A5B7K1H5_PORTR|nr:hypothetical protein [Portunus trituberculatus]